MVLGLRAHAAQLAACLAFYCVGTVSSFADPGHGVCIQGTNPGEHNQPIGYIERSCLKSPVDGSTNCDDWEKDSLEHDTPDSINAIKIVKTWPRQLATDEKLDT